MIACYGYESSRVHYCDLHKGQKLRKEGQHHWKSIEGAFLLVIICALMCSHEAAAFTASRPKLPQNNRQQFTITKMRRMNMATYRRRAGLVMYLPPSPSTQTAPMVAQSIIAAGENKKHRRNCFLSNSVLSDSDTLPSFPTAHGLLSPETVMRMEEITNQRNQRNGAVAYFLDTYREHGPMACLPMLSDPSLLPKLTEAMRDIA